MGNKSKKKKQSGPSPSGSHPIGKARRRNRMLIYGVVGFVVVAWLAAFIGWFLNYMGYGVPAQP